ncbi:hypothetical protein MWU78_20500 [Arenibacter sp. F26102]|uniref:hypothetical protein n=1 Tax=Arenibacter sp. F26102 TaxID=2926416 RepID=UPI001FF4EA31|nr:hypothetical protein [Arenibacter sp. F26102]MCK0148039.1 hypothetical protein [Arenibacter sp. F26102]
MKYVKEKLWLLCCISAAAIIVFGLSPLALPKNTFDPKLFGMPYVLWVNILLSIGLVLLTVLGTFVHPGSINSSEE